MATFGQIPAYQTSSQFDFGISDDKRAFTLSSIADLEIAFEVSKSATPIETRLFSLVVPLDGENERVEIAFSVSANVLTGEDATATLVFSVNGQTTVVDFATVPEQSFVEELVFATYMPSECRLSVFLLVGGNKKNPNADAFLKVQSIDAEILPRPV